jgi:hypothetical protein
VCAVLNGTPHPSCNPAKPAEFRPFLATGASALHPHELPRCSKPHCWMTPASSRSLPRSMRSRQRIRVSSRSRCRRWMQSAADGHHRRTAARARTARERTAVRSGPAAEQTRIVELSELEPVGRTRPYGRCRRSASTRGREHCRDRQRLQPRDFG